MADSKMRYCRLCNGPCEGRSICLQTPDRFKPSTDMIKTALEMQGAFSGREFLGHLHVELGTGTGPDISLKPPEFTVTDRADGGCEVVVRLKWMRFIPEYRNPWSPERKRLAEAAREEIFRSFDLPRGKFGEGDIKVDIKEGSVLILIIFNASVIAIAAVTIAGLCSVDRARGARAPGANVSANGMPVGPPGMPRPERARGDIAREIRHVAAAATGAVIGAVAGSVAGPIGMGVGGAIGSFVGGLFAR